MPKSTLYAALRGQRLPTVPVLAALVRAWGGKEVEWLMRRMDTEAQIERLRLALREIDAEDGPEIRKEITHEEHRRLQEEWAARRPSPNEDELIRVLVQAMLQDGHQILKDRDIPSDTSRRLPESQNASGARSKAEENWVRLRGAAGAPSIRSLSRSSGLSFVVVSEILRGRREGTEAAAKLERILKDHARHVEEFLNNGPPADE
ncbi:hypothetical protein ACFZCT_29055 [Streptomyces qaidamensis]|uniref:hypothetical protein n=1 Tax=Streptomyces qaidamensis TaxID=1783515 RepID=UPI0036E45F99